MESEGERQILYDTLNLIYCTDELIYRKKTDLWTWRTDAWLPRGGGGSGVGWEFGVNGWLAWPWGGVRGGSVLGRAG